MRSGRLTSYQCAIEYPSQMEVGKMSKSLKIHNRVTPEQISLKPGDLVEQTVDDGTKQNRVVKYAPWRVGAQWLIGLVGTAGGYALCRCKPIKSENSELAKLRRDNAALLAALKELLADDFQEALSLSAVRRARAVVAQAESRPTSEREAR
jgi:hypothetical protein